MPSNHLKERWHSNGCLLYFRGNLCKKGHTNLLDVLCYSVMESVILFCTADELKCVSHGIVELMELQDEAIMVKAMAPVEAHITTYMMVWHSTGDGKPHTPPQQTPPSGGTLHCLQADLGGLADHKLQQLMEELHQEITQCAMNAPPSNPLQANGHAHWAVGNPRRVTRRSPFQEGEGVVH